MEARGKKCNVARKWGGGLLENEPGESVRERERESGLSAMPLQPSSQIRAATSLENVTFSWSRQGRDGGSGKGGAGVVEDKW